MGSKLYCPKRFKYRIFRHTIRVIKKQKKDDGIAWGAVYWQYFENMDKTQNTYKCVYAPEFTSHSKGIRIKIN